MKTIIIGSLLFLVWSVLSTFYYVRHTKGPGPENPDQVVQVIKEEPPVAVEPAPEPKIESPGSFTVYHDFDRSEFISDDQFNDYIQRTDTYGEQDETAKLNVVGYTDHIGPEDYNFKLGMRRAASIKKTLVSNGISEQIISISSKGESSPVATNETKSGRALNRRTEIQVIH